MILESEKISHPESDRNSKRVDFRQKTDNFETKTRSRKINYLIKQPQGAAVEPQGEKKHEPTNKTSSGRLKLSVLLLEPIAFSLPFNFIFSLFEIKKASYCLKRELEGLAIISSLHRHIFAAC